MKKIFLFIVTIIISIQLCACQSNPKSNQIISKNDKIYDIRVSQTSPAPNADLSSKLGQVSETSAVSYVDSFLSTDKSVNFSFNIQERIHTDNIPIVEVSPHYLTEEDAQHVAEVIFEGASFFEAQPLLSVVYSKSEIIEKLHRWSSYANEDAIKELYGELGENILPVIRMFIADYNQRLETAPEKAPQVPCKWNFQKSLLYRYTTEELEELGISVSNDSEEISAHLSHNDAEYQYTVITRNKNDFKLNYISIVPDFGMSPYDLDTMILLAKKCRTNKPTQDQLVSAQSKVASWLNKMNLGEWDIDQCFIQTTPYGSSTEYRIYVKAVPAFRGAVAIRRPQLSDLKSTNTYASNYDLTDAEFILSPDGDLLGLHLFSPVDMINIVNENPNVLSINKLLGIAKNYFQLSDIYAYGFGSVMEQQKKGFNCHVDICDMEYGLSRIKVPNTEETYYYVPSVALRGNVEYTTQDSNEICFKKRMLCYFS